MNSTSDIRALVAKFKALGCDPDFADFIEQTLSLRGNEPGVWLELAANLRQQGAYEAALHTYNTAERRFPNMAQLQNNKGILLRECGMLEDALVAFRQAITLRPDYADALEGQGHVLELLGRFAEAETVYQKLVKIEPARATAWNNLGNCALQLGRKQEARQHYERAIELDPDYVFALVNLAGLVDEFGDRARATLLVDRALELDPQDEVATQLKDRFLRSEAVVTLEPPAWNPPALENLLAAQSFQDVLEQQKREQRVVSELLKRTKALTDRAGFLAWDPERLATEPDGDPGPTVVRLRPPTPEAPRLYIAYAWSVDDPSQLDGAYEQDLLVDRLAGHLFNSGYDIVYDRDPRNMNKGLNEIDVLRRLYDCNFFIPVVTERYLAKIAPGGNKRGMVGAEWDLACQLEATGFLSFIGIWVSGESLPNPLNELNTVDFRDDPAFYETIEEMFPSAIVGECAKPKIPARPRPPEPADWPTYIPPEQNI